MIERVVIEERREQTGQVGAATRAHPRPKAGSFGAGIHHRRNHIAFSLALRTTRRKRAEGRVDAGQRHPGRAAQQHLFVVALGRPDLVEPGVGRLHTCAWPTGLHGAIPQEVCIRDGQQLGWVAAATRKIADLTATVEIKGKLRIVFQTSIEPG